MFKRTGVAIGVLGLLTAGIEKNPAALREIAERLIEAQDRSLWRPRSNSARPHLEALAARVSEASPPGPVQ